MFDHNNMSIRLRLKTESELRDVTDVAKVVDNKQQAPIDRRLTCNVGGDFIHNCFCTSGILHQLDFHRKR